MQDIGFVYYWWVHDYRTAADWFNRASQVPGAPWWLRSLAATTLAEGGDRRSSRTMWEVIHQSAEIDWLRRDAERRLSQHADVPTLAEVGFPGMRAAQWVAAFAPSAVPADIVETLRKAFVAAMSVPEMQAAFARGGMVVPRRSALADAKGWLRDEMASWRRDVQDTGIVVED